jgi:hypothetical protein
VISIGALTPILVCFHKLEITPPSNSNHLRDGTFRSLPKPKRRLGGESAPLGQHGRASVFVNVAVDEMTLLIEMVVDLRVN